MDLTSNAGLHDPFYPKSAIVSAFEDVEKRLCCIEEELKPIKALCGPGGVVFTDAVGEVVNDCDTFFFDPVDVKLGIGTNAPEEELHIWTDSSIAEMKIEAVNHDAIITLLSDDARNAYIDYEETSGNRWIVGSYSVNDEFAWADGSAFSSSRRLSLTREAGGVAASTLRLWEGGASTSFIGLKAPDVVASNNVYTLPTAYPAGAGDVLSSDLAGNLSWIPAAGGGGIFLKDAAVGNNIWSDNTTQPAGSSDDNFLAGETAGNVLNNSDNNIAIGNRAMELLTTTESMTVIGVEALKNATTAETSVIIGHQAVEIGDNVSRSVYIGNLAGNSTAGEDNVAIGYGALNSATGRGGSHIIAIGDNAMGDSGATAPGTIEHTIAIGHQAGFRLGNPGDVTIADNVFIGRLAGGNIDSSVGGSSFAQGITTIGARAGSYQNLLSPGNPSIGVRTMTAIGSDCLGGVGQLAPSYNNIPSPAGSLVLPASTTAIGHAAGIALKRSRSSLLAGTYTAAKAEGLQRCTILGEYAVYDTDSDTDASGNPFATRIEGLTAVGYRAVGGVLNGVNVGTASVIIGSEALAGNSQGNNSAFESVIIGEQAGANTSLNAAAGGRCILIGQGVDFSGPGAQNEINIGDFYKGENTGAANAKATIEGGLTVNSTDEALVVPRMTTAQEGALTAINGMIIYNTTTNKFRAYEAGVWVNMI